MFTPKLTPGRMDKLGPMIVYRDIFEEVTQNDGWASSIDTFKPASRRKYLESIKYWMDINGACVVRNASTGRFAVLKDINVCATILPGNVLRGGFDVVPENAVTYNGEPLAYNSETVTYT